MSTDKRTPTSYKPSDLDELRILYQGLTQSEQRYIKDEIYGVIAVFKACEAVKPHASKLITE